MKSRISENRKVTLTLKQLKRLVRESGRLVKESDFDEASLAELLPHGSGIDYDWEFSRKPDGTIEARNAWHYMNGNGYYIGALPFTMELKPNGDFDGPFFDSVDELAKSGIGQEIANDVAYSDEYSDDDVDGIEDRSWPDLDHIEDVLREEIRSLSDMIYGMFEDSVNKVELSHELTRFGMTNERAGKRVREARGKGRIVSESKEARAVINAIQDLRAHAYHTIGKLLENIDDKSMKEDLLKAYKREVGNIFIDLEVKAQGW